MWGALILGLLSGPSLTGFTLARTGAFVYFQRMVHHAELRDSLLVLVFEDGDTVSYRIREEDRRALEQYFMAPEASPPPLWVDPEGDVYFGKDLEPYQTYVMRNGLAALGLMLGPAISGVFSPLRYFPLLISLTAGWLTGDYLDREQTLRNLKEGRRVRPGEKHGVEIWGSFLGLPEREAPGSLYGFPARSLFSGYPVLLIRLFAPFLVNGEIGWERFKLLDVAYTPRGDPIAYRTWEGWALTAGIFAHTPEWWRTSLGVSLWLGTGYGNFREHAAWGETLEAFLTPLILWGLRGEVIFRPLPRNGLRLRLGVQRFDVFGEVEPLSRRRTRRIGVFGGVGYAF